MGAVYNKITARVQNKQLCNSTCYNAISTDYGVNNYLKMVNKVSE